MSEQVIQCTSACTVTHVHEISIPLLNLSEAEGGAIAVAVLAVWAAGFGIRALIQLVKNSDGGSSEEN